MASRRPAVLASSLVGLLLAAPAIAGEGPRVCLAIDGERVAQHGAFDCRTSLGLSALRREYVAFQVVVEAGDEPLEGLTVELEADDGSPYALRFDVFLQHFVDVPRRSRTGDQRQSLAFTAAARPEDEGLIGELPDALVPVARAPRWLPYPFAAAPSRRAALYLEAFVPDTAPAGKASYRLRVLRGADPIATLPLAVEILPIQLPYQATPTFAFYERATLAERFADADGVEKELVRMLHAHHVDAITQLLAVGDLERIRGALDGSWFRAAGADDVSGYRGPGAGVGASVLAIGAYGTLGDPSPSALPALREIVDRTPASVRDVFLYAIDETCDSPRGPDWRKLLREGAAPERLRVAHTCAEPPAGQGVDIAMMPAQAFDPDLADEARALGKQVWIYNGMWPHAGPLMLDVPLGSLTANGWIGAAFDVGRWFYWETIFWNDKNRGGRGPVDVFATAETFHNADGDTALYDGLLVYPGRMPGAFAAHDLGWDGVLPSLRLKALRRGNEDAGLLALAAQVDPDATFAVSRRIVVAALDEVDERSPLRADLRPAQLAAARAELRALAVRAEPPAATNPLQVARGLADLRARRSADRRATGAGQRYASPVVALLVLPGFLFGLGYALAWLLRRAEHSRHTPGR